MEAKVSNAPLKVVVRVETVEQLLRARPKTFDVVVLDLLLVNGSEPGDNAMAVDNAGYPALVFSDGDNSAAIREAHAAGASGISRQSEECDQP